MARTQRFLHVTGNGIWREMLTFNQPQPKLFNAQNEPI